MEACASKLRFDCNPRRCRWNRKSQQKILKSQKAFYDLNPGAAGFVSVFISLRTFLVFLSILSTTPGLTLTSKLLNFKKDMIIITKAFTYQGNAEGTNLGSTIFLDDAATVTVEGNRMHFTANKFQNVTKCLKSRDKGQSRNFCKELRKLSIMFFRRI